MIRRRLTVAGDLDQENVNSKLSTTNQIFFFFFFFLRGGGGGGGYIHPQSLWGSGAVARASQLVCPKLSAVLIARCTGVE